MSERCIGDSKIVLEYPYDSVAVSREEAIHIINVLSFADDVTLKDLHTTKFHADVDMKYVFGIPVYVIRISNWTVSTILHELAHINAWEIHGEKWGYHDWRFKKEQERLYAMYAGLADLLLSVSCEK